MFEIIIIDDGSTDKSYSIASSFSDKRIRLFKQRNKGVSSARNFGILKSKYDLIAFLDADDFWKPNYLYEMYNCICEYPDAALYGCAYDIFTKNKKSKTYHFPFPKKFKGYVENYFKVAFKSILFLPSAVIIRKNHCEFPLFDERVKLGEDLLAWFKIALRNKVFFFNKVLSFYRQYETGQTKHKIYSINETHLPYLYELYEFYKNNAIYSKFISWHCAKIARRYFFDKERKDVTEKVLPLINFSQLPFYWFLIYKMPYFIMKYFYRITTSLKAGMQK